MKKGEQFVRWQNCPHCKGRGYFLKNPFIVRWENLVMPDNFEACVTCARAKEFYEVHEREPNSAELKEIQEREMDRLLPLESERTIL